MKRWTAILIAVTCALLCVENAFAQTKKAPPVKAKVATKAQAKPAQGQVATVVPSNKSSFLSAPTIRKPATLDPNSAVEVRGQARTLSMMLVLKNGKDSINFIKVRKDYRPEIQATDY